MSKIFDEVMVANQRYAAAFSDKGKLALSPVRHFAILTCIDARLDPARYAGFSGGDAHVIRNAGDRVSDDAIQSLVISYKLLGTKEWSVIHHTDCGMQLSTDEVIGRLLEQSLETATIDGEGWHDHGTGPGSVHGHYVKWHTISDLEGSVTEDVNPHIAASARARGNSDLWLLLRRENRIYGRSRDPCGCAGHPIT